MTGVNKPSNYPKIYLIRVSEKTKAKLLKLGSKKVRNYLEKL